MLALRGVTIEFGGRRALEGVDLAVAAGEVVALVGPSGAGKTTLLSACNGTVRATRGAVVVEGHDIARLGPAELRAVRSRIGTIPQDPSLVPNLRVAQNIVAGRLGRRGTLGALRSLVWPARDDLTDAHALLERLGLAERLFDRTDTLSGGQRQRVAIARALFQEPQLLLADEPIAAVDPSRARDVLELLVSLAREHGLALLTSLHDVRLARELFPRVVGLRAGRVAFDGAPGEVPGAAWDALFALEGHP